MWPPDPDTAIKVGWTVAALAFLVAVLSAIGEYRGWWGLIGQIGMTVGMVVSILVAMGTYVYGTGRDQLDKVYNAVESHGETLRMNHRTLRSMDTTMDAVGEALAGGMIQELDVIQVELDRQTGVLDDQVEILGEIRDRL